MPGRGEVWMVDFGMVGKVRPALALNVEPDDEGRVLTTWVSHTTTVRGSKFEAVFPIRFLREGGFNAQSIPTLPSRATVRYLGALTQEQLAQVEEKLRLWLGL